MIIKSKYNFLIPFKVKKLIRLGRNFDGGYLVCKDALKHCENLITLGVGDDISFENDFRKKTKPKNIYLYDYTVNHILFLRIIIKYFRRLITFRTKFENFIHSIKNYINFLFLLGKSNVYLFKLRVVKKIQKKFDIKFNEIFKKIKSDKNLLKIDIEGSEYEIIDDIIKLNSKLKVIIIEFHNINKNKNIFIRSVKKLKKNFDIIHLHANNYLPIKNNYEFFDVIEISFVNKNINMYRKEIRKKFPIKNLDFECFPDRKKIYFKFEY